MIGSVAAAVEASVARSGDRRVAVIPEGLTSSRCTGRPEHGAARPSHLDPLGGMAGDMFLAAVLDAHPEPRRGRAAMRAAGLPDGWQTRLLRHDDGVLSGRRVRSRRQVTSWARRRGTFATSARTSARRRCGGARARDRDLHRARRGRGGGARRAGRRGAFPRDRRLGLGRRYRRRRWLIEALAPTTWSVGALPVGSGRIRTRHGR